MNKKTHYYFWYFIIFSILGLIIETLFCYITTGVIESRKGLLIGPFCPIYGVGAVCLIFGLEKYKENPIKIAIYGSIIGSIVEYLLSFGLEAMYGARFWDYSYNVFNLNGRICLIYSVYWGILSLILLKYVLPGIDKYISKIPEKDIKIVDSILFVFFIFNVFSTIWSINVYETRVKNEYYGINTIKEYSLKTKIEDTVFNNNAMKKIFPNLRLRNPEGEIIFVKSMIKE